MSRPPVPIPTSGDHAATMEGAHARIPLGRQAIPCSRLGIGSSYGLDADGVRHAFDRGLNLFYWGTWRRNAFGDGLSDLARTQRDSLAVVVQTYSRVAALMGPSLESALRRLRIEQADFLLLGMWNRSPPPRILDRALELVERGLARSLIVSCHRRTTFPLYAADTRIGSIMVRYNSAHPGAEEEVFPHLGNAPPGVISYTATSWGRIVDPEKTPPGEKTPRASDCYRFALTRPEVDVCLSGPRDMEQLDEALAALDRGPMDADQIAWMKRVGAATG